jgi:microcystin degradation protein MlrC
MTKRILVGGIWHETNSFSPIPTDLAAFRAFQYLEGDALFDELRGTNCEIGGMLAAAPRHDLELIPSVHAGAVPSGIVTRAALDAVVGRLVADARATEGLDGILLALHGAMVADGIDEADAHVVSALRAAVGPRVPIVASFDSHANMTESLVAAADILVGYDTLPHVDMGARGEEAAALIARLLGTGDRPTKAYRRVPLLSVPQMQATTDGPMKLVSDLRAEIERDPAIWTCSAIMGFPYCDVPQLGMGALAYGEAGAARLACDRLAARIWALREDFLPRLVSPAEAVHAAATANTRPRMLVEPADNVGGGAPGDGTTILAALVAARPDSGVAVIWDPRAAAEAARIGVGGRFDGPVGGRTLALHGAPVRVAGHVRFAAPARYRRDKAYFNGQSVDMGPSAVIDLGGFKIVVTSERIMPFDTAHLRAVGIDPERERLITMKCGSNWSAGFGDVAAGHAYVDTPGITSSNVERMPYARFRGPAFPLQRDLDWTPGD